MTKPPNSDDALVLDTLSVITDRLKILATRQKETWWDIGRLLDAMAVQGLGRNQGIRDYAAYAHRVVGLDRAEARQFQRIAHCFSRDVAMRFGPEKLDLLLKLVEADQLSHRFVDPMSVEVLSKRADGTLAAIPFAQCSEEDLRFSARSATRRNAASDPRVPGQIGFLRDRVEAALAVELSRRAPQVRVDLDPSKRSTPCLALFGILPQDLDVVGRVLVAAAKALRPAKTSPPPRKRAAARKKNRS